MKRREDIICKIKKLMAIANDPSASDQEIQLSTYKARKLMIEFKINEIDLIGTKEDKEVARIILNEQGSGYIIFVLNALSDHFQCKFAYIGKIIDNNCKFVIYGLKNDVEIAKIVADSLIYYLNNMLHDLKESYIGYEDFRIYKRSYLQGFANGLAASLKNAYIEMKVDTKYGLAVYGVPAIVEQEFTNNVNIKKSNFQRESEDAWHLGKKHGMDYNINRFNLLK